MTAAGVVGAGGWYDGLRVLEPALRRTGARPPEIRCAGSPGAGPVLSVRSLEALNRMAAEAGQRVDSGAPLRFVDAQAVGTLSAVDYERCIAATGRVPTRLAGAGAWHDWFNALAWLAWPQTKRALNAAQVAAMAPPARHPRAPHGEPAAHRGRRRDALTLFDESGLVMVCDRADLRHRLRTHDWAGLFVSSRAGFAVHARLFVLGHGLLDKLRTPFKAACGRVWLLPLPADADRGCLDARLGASIRCGAPFGEALHPLPVLGVPGWWADNQDPAFYDDAAVFRPMRADRTPRRGPGRVVSTRHRASLARMRPNEIEARP